jgi:26 proteasome complex subunit DSS1
MASDPKPEDQPTEEKKPEQKTTALGEDDEFEDFPVDGTHLPPQCYLETCQKRAEKGRLTGVDWPEEQTEAAQGNGDTKHLWEESWDDDDTTDDFSTQLK